MPISQFAARSKNRKCPKKYLQFGKKQMRGTCNWENWIVPAILLDPFFFYFVSNESNQIELKSRSGLSWATVQPFAVICSVQMCPVSVSLSVQPSVCLSVRPSVWLILELGLRDARCILPLPFDNCHNAVWHGLELGSRPIPEHVPQIVGQLIFGSRFPLGSRNDFVGNL